LDSISDLNKMAAYSGFDMSITRSESTDNLAYLMAEEGSEGAAKAAAALNGLVSFFERLRDSRFQKPLQYITSISYAVFCVIMIVFYYTFHTFFCNIVEIP
jgi:hypothetical protein